MEPSEALEARIREHASHLDHFFDRITSCHVVVDMPHRHHHKGQLYEARIHMHVPGQEIVVNREGRDHAHEDAYVAVRDAFEVAERRLEDVIGRWKDHHAAREASPKNNPVNS